MLKKVPMQHKIIPEKGVSFTEKAAELIYTDCKNLQQNNGQERERARRGRLREKNVRKKLRL